MTKKWWEIGTTGHPDSAPMMGGIAAIEQLRSLDRRQPVSNAVVAAQAARWADCATASGTGRR